MRIGLVVLVCLPFFVQAEEFSFDLSGYEKKDFEWGGHLEFMAEQLQFDQSSALYNLNFFDNSNTDSLNRYTGVLELNGLYRFNNSILHFRGQAKNQDDKFGSQQQSTVHEFYYAFKSNDNLNYELGKRVLKWGKGYAWNPVAFAERVKDPNDPDLNREGFVLATADYTKSFTNTGIKTLSFTPVILPVDSDINNDFGKKNDTNVGAKLYMLYRDTDIDLMFLAGDSRGDRFGADFSSNLTPNFEWHGEFAYFKDQPVNTIDETNQLIQNIKNITQALIGLRYLSESEITWILEYYYNSGGYTEAELDRFYTLASVNSLTDPVLFNTAQAAQTSGFGRPNFGRDYIYLRASKKDILDIVYLSGGLTGIINVNDSSYSLMPELIYTGIKNMEMRARITWLEGDKFTEFGEKPNSSKIEFRVRYFI